MSVQIPKKMLFLTPAIGGADGISMVCRQAVNSCLPLVENSQTTLDVWSLSESGNERLQFAASGVGLRIAGGSKLRYASWGLGQSLRDARDLLVVAFHIGVAPVALPMVARGATFCLFIHGVEIWRRLGTIESLAVRKASTVISNSGFTLQKFTEHNPHLELQRTKVCHLGTPTASPTSPRRQSAPFALTVGRMSSHEHYKGHDELLESWSYVAKVVPSARLVIAGEGDDRPRLERKCRELGLAEHVRFLGRVDDEQLSTLYHECEFFVMPSTGEGFGLVFLEAMLAGKACIGGIRAPAEIIREGETGYIVDRSNQSQLQARIVQLFQDQESRQSMGRAGADRVQSCFTEHHFHQRFQSSLGLRMAG